ncbi:MAG: MBOAT family protein [Parvularculaceae bacterium]|nr:MBOAT family protein [Parvularculaceae bacterium]
MLFNSTVFFLFFAAFFVVYWRLRGNIFGQNALIYGGSLAFYGWWDERFLILIALSTAIDYIAALGAAGEKASAEERRKAGLMLICVAVLATAPTFSTSWVWFAAVIAFLATGRILLPFIRGRKSWLIVSLVANLGLLAAFKYFGFFTESFIAAAEAIGVHVNAPMMRIILPIGISFYTFQTLSYTIDVYRGDMKPTRSLLNFAAYVSFFPQLVAGPIERARALLPQFAVERRWDGERAFDGALLFLWGLYKKTVIADNLAPIVNAAFAAPGETAAPFMLLAALASALQIYCDFSGYSDMARGLAKTLGFELMINFNLPYMSRTPSEFWRRWHISLSSWLRDYLYVPLGGNRGGERKTYRNLFLTMLLGGLWHGAAWNFVAWGAFHGAILAVYRFLHVDDALGRVRAGTRPGVAAHLSAWIVMSTLTLVGWIFFRIESLADAPAALEKIFSAQAMAGIASLPEAAMLGALALPLIISHVANRFLPETIARVVAYSRGPGGAPLLARANAFALLLCCVTFLPAEGQLDFIYFDF